MKKIYIAGPMRGYKDFNFPAFDTAEAKLKHEGWDTISPAQMDRDIGFDELKDVPTQEWIDDAIARDINAIMGCDAICLLDGWEKSTGANAEKALAEWRGIPVYLYRSMKDINDESICEEAYRIQGGDRQQDYGSPKENFNDIATLWNDYLFCAHAVDAQIDARDVAHLMILMKIARNAHKPKRDNWVDVAGYAQCGGKVDEDE